MALPTLTDAKSVLRIEDTSEDTLVTAYLARAQAAIETLLGYALTAAAITHTDHTETDNYGVQPVLRLPGPFKSSGPAPVVVDVNGDTVDDDGYDLDPRNSQIRAKAGYSFPHRPYTVTATVGLSAHPDYTAQLEAVASTAILDLVAHYHLQRNPALKSETDEGGGSRELLPDAIPPRVLEHLDLLPGPHRMGFA